MEWRWNIFPNLSKIGPKNEKIIESIQKFLSSKKVIRFENPRFI